VRGESMRKYLVFLLSFFLVFICAVPTRAEKPTYKDLVTQQLLIYELTRSIKDTNDDIHDLKSKVKKLESKISTQEKYIDSSKDDVKKVLLNLYSGDETAWVEMILSSDNLQDVFTLQYMADKSIKSDFNKLEQLDKKLSSLENDKKDMLKKSKKLTSLNQALHSRLSEVQKAEAYYKNDLKLVDDVEKAKKEVDTLLYNWENTGLPTFKDFFSILVDNMQDLPEMITKKNYKPKGIFTHSITITDVELNRFLQSKNDIFKNVRFTFDNEKLYAKGSYEKMDFSIVGHYHLVSPEEMEFFIDNIEFEGIQLPNVTIKEMEDRYDLGFYPSEIFPGATIKKMNMDNGKLTVEVKL
jgi:peptidoglycan hydrolase CwlO-like protein